MLKFCNIGRRVIFFSLKTQKRQDRIYEHKRLTRMGIIEKFGGYPTVAAVPPLTKGQKHRAIREQNTSYAQ